MTNIEAAATFARVLGRPVEFQHIPLPVVRSEMGEEFYQMFRWFNESGFQADIPALKKKCPEVHLLNLEEWLMKEGWHKRARPVKLPKE